MRRSALAVLLILLCALAAWAQDRVLPGQPNEKAVAAYERGERLVARRKFELAAQYFDQAAKLAPMFHLAHFAAGNALAQAGKLREAETRYDEAVSVAPKFAPGWNALGVVQMTGGRIETALESFDRALAADANHLLARQHRAQALLQLRRPEEAEAELRKVLRKDPKSADARVALCAAVHAQGRTKESREMLTRVLVDAPAHGGALLLRVTLDLREEELDDAAAGLGEVLQKAGDQKSVRAELARLAARVADAARSRGEVRAQIRALETLVTLLPRNPKVHSRLGAARLALYESRAKDARDAVELERALASLERSLELDPDQEPVRKLLDHYR